MRENHMAFSIQDVPSIAITFVVIAVVLGVGATILTQIRQGQGTTADLAYNITTQGLNAQATLSSWQGTWVVIVASAVVLGVIAGYLMMR